MEVLKTHVGANRNDSLKDAVQKTWARGGVRGFYQGLIPWAWIEASTKGAILILTSTEVECYAKRHLNADSAIAGGLGGVAGGAAQAYLTMGFTTCMKTVEVTRTKNAMTGARVPGPMEAFFDILRTKGIRGVNRGVNAVALRQITGWSSRIGIARLAETNIRSFKGKSAKDKLSFGETVAASTIGGALSCWNQPFEVSECLFIPRFALPAYVRLVQVVRIEMQSLKADPTRPASPTMVNTAKHILATSGPLGFFRGIVPRIGVASWATICMVGLGDIVKEALASRGHTRK
ncbi:Hypothetical protein NCS54_01446000 [Fusarium falciforme]|uniref:Hypothetical protein n=1 Tax=Fusarium falciforme TaxID=195108 RepID=UPI0023019A9D|nr:Hypothetical protein NCS54_01446000 [Fusarium falciforme]WAO96776.1 Hypothetical protein NCS54_01446000 [Fusarium falciforme]